MHTAYNLATGEIICLPWSGNEFKRFIARHTANDLRWLREHGEPAEYRWVFAHGRDYDECVAKLMTRKVWG